MTFSIDQIAELSAPLDRAKVKSRTQGGSSVSYIEAYHAENEANRIFGFDAWDRETTLHLIGEPRVTQDKYGKDQFRVAYRAKVRITVRTPTAARSSARAAASDPASIRTSTKPTRAPLRRPRATPRSAP